MTMHTSPTIAISFELMPSKARLDRLLPAVPRVGETVIFVRDDGEAYGGVVTDVDWISMDDGAGVRVVLVERDLSALEVVVSPQIK